MSQRPSPGSEVHYVLSRRAGTSNLRACVGSRREARWKKPRKRQPSFVPLALAHQSDDATREFGAHDGDVARHAGPGEALPGAIEGACHQTLEVIGYLRRHGFADFDLKLCI